jgi:A/G-specific adenine glycosylase
MPTSIQFQKIIWTYYRAHPRPMPWRRARDRRDPYRILVSEIMLQQTQVARVVGFYEKFIKLFPDFGTLAQAKTPDVLRAWQGLGYNRRALALQKLAKEVLEKYSGRLPRDAASLIVLPGVGPYTAGAIRAFAFNEPEIFIETNIRRVFIHFFFSSAQMAAQNKKNTKKTGGKVTDEAIRRYIERTIDRKNPREWYWALMDYGAMLGEAARGKNDRKNGGKTSTAIENPNRRSAHYVRQSKFVGSDREIRGKILRELLAKPKISTKTLPARIVDGLVKDGFILQKGRYIKLVGG